MPIEGFPDPERHTLCFRCRKWHEPDEGIVMHPEATGPLSGLRNARRQFAGDESGMRFYCHRCLRVRRRTKLVIFGLLVATVLTLGVVPTLYLVYGRGREKLRTALAANGAEQNGTVADTPPVEA